jgi:ribA/ribD-fused uncharacterized protein
MDVITFTKVSLPNGWLSNMSPYPIEFGGKKWLTSEALFQSLRFNDDDIKELIRAEKSPMGAKDIMNENTDKLSIIKHSRRDVINMKMCIRIKLRYHPILLGKLLETGDKEIIEDVTARGIVGGNLFWGAMLIDGKWEGENTLGKIWMELREQYRLILK